MIFSGFEYLGVILVTAIPFGIYDLVEAMDNVESAEAAGDAYPTTRVLTADGVLMVYDFGPGIRFRSEGGLEDWFARFSERYPAPANEARTLSPAILAEMNSGFRMVCGEPFELGIALTRDFYVDYMMTETNVAAAVRDGASYAEIRSWCAETLRSAWRDGPDREVIFEGYFACMSPAGRTA